MHPNTVRTALAELRTAGLVERSRAAAEGRGRPSFEYSLTVAGRHAQPSGRAFREYRSLTEAFASHLAAGSPDPSGDARAIGRTWGAALAGEDSAAGGDSAAGEGSATGEDSAASGHSATGEGSAARGDSTAGGSAAEEQTTAARSGAEERVVDLLAELGFGPDPDPPGIALRTCPLLDLAREMPEVICQVHRGLVEGAMDHYGAPSDQVDLVPFAEVGACRLHLHRESLERAPGGTGRRPGR